MAGVNKVIICGHLGKDPQISRSSSGGKIATLSVATSESWRDKATGERKDRTEWHRVVIFNPALAEVAEQRLRKGSKVYLEGQNATREWTDREGITRWVTEVVLRPFRGELVLLDKSEHAPAPDESAYGTTRTRDAGPPAADLDDQIPY